MPSVVYCNGEKYCVEEKRPLDNKSDVEQARDEIREKIYELLNDSDYCYWAVQLALEDVIEHYKVCSQYTKMCDIPASY